MNDLVFALGQFLLLSYTVGWKCIRSFLSFCNPGYVELLGLAPPGNAPLFYLLSKRDLTLINLDKLHNPRTTVWYDEAVQTGCVDRTIVR